MIRRGRAEDIDAVAALYERSFATITFLPVLHTLDEHRRYFARVASEQELWVYEESGTVRGFMTLGDDTLGYIFVDVGATERGIGSELLDHAKRRRPDGFTLWTFQQNEGARRFYERHGLKPIRFTDGAQTEEQAPDVQYEWRP